MGEELSSCHVVHMLHRECSSHFLRPSASDYFKSFILMRSLKHVRKEPQTVKKVMTLLIEVFGHF